MVVLYLILLLIHLLLERFLDQLRDETISNINSLEYLGIDLLSYFLTMCFDESFQVLVDQVADRFRRL